MLKRKQVLPFDARRQLWTMCLLVGTLCCTTWVVACQVPVFRYALERWFADKYEIVLFHDGPLDKRDQAGLAQLRAAIDDSTNASVRTQAISESKDPEHAALWANRDVTRKSLIAVFYPQGAREIPERLLTVLPYGDDPAKHLFDSPIRGQIVKRLVGGQSAVWVFVPSGDAEKDDSALRTLTEQLEQCQQKLKLPPVEDFDLESAKVQEQISQMRIEFSSVTVKREDREEQYLLKMLLRSEADLATSDEPLAFPVFGRGRVLYALVGKGINPEMIHSACQFMVGPCSCQVKAQNPGFDLLTRLNWELAVGEEKISDPLPEASSVPTLLKIPSGRKAK